MKKNEKTADANSKSCEYIDQVIQNAV